MREKIVLRQRETPIMINLPNGTFFVARYERISRKQLPRNIRDNRRILLILTAPAFRKIRENADRLVSDWEKI